MATSLIETSKTIAYHALDFLVAGKGFERAIGGEKIRFPTRWARYYEADYEPNTFAFLRSVCREGDTILDLGAHIGLFSVLFARLVGKSGRVFAFEPTPQTNAVLRETIELNNCQKIVEVRPEAVARTSGEAILFDTGTAGSNANSLVKTERHNSGVKVKTVSIDDFVRARNLRVNCLKIDVEGAELRVLEGASQTLLEQRPVIHLALHPQPIKQGEDSLEEIWDLLEGLGFSISFNQRLVKREWFIMHEDLFDVQYIPTEKAFGHYSLE